MSGIQRPNIPPRATAGLAEAMISEVNPSAVLRRWGIVEAIRSNGTLDVNVAGQTLENIKRNSTYTPTIGERVFLDVVGTDMVVTGATGPSPKNQNLRTAQITAVNALPDNRVSIRFTDTNEVVTNVARAAVYNPTIDETVQVEQSGPLGTYIVIGPAVTNTSTNRNFLRLPTGTFQPYLGKTAPPGTVICFGQELSRTTYKNLFDWATAQGIIGTEPGSNVFGLGNGTTTFTIPDLRSRVLSGADSTNVLGSKFGAANRSLSVGINSNNLPLHSHSVDLPDHPGHIHDAVAGGVPHTHGFSATVSTPDRGGHTGHHPTTQTWVTSAAVGSGSAVAAWNASGTSSGLHNHGDLTVSGGSGAATAYLHDHEIKASTPLTHPPTLTSNSGQAAGTQVPLTMNADVQQPSFSCNYILWV